MTRTLKIHTATGDPNKDTSKLGLDTNAGFLGLFVLYCADQVADLFIPVIYIFR